MSSPAGELVSTDTDVIRRVHGFRVRDSGHFSISVFARTRIVIQLAGTYGGLKSSSAGELRSTVTQGRRVHGLRVRAAGLASKIVICGICGRAIVQLTCTDFAFSSCIIPHRLACLLSRFFTFTSLIVVMQEYFVWRSNTSPMKQLSKPVFVHVHQELL